MVVGGLDWFGYELRIWFLWIHGKNPNQHQLARSSPSASTPSCSQAQASARALSAGLLDSFLGQSQGTKVTKARWVCRFFCGGRPTWPVSFWFPCKTAAQPWPSKHELIYPETQKGSWPCVFYRQCQTVQRNSPKPVSREFKRFPCPK